MLYNNKTFYKYCEDNGISLLDNYESVKIDRDYKIKGLCTTPKCNKDFYKTFRQMVKTGAYCGNCVSHNAKARNAQNNKYNVEYLITYCNENNITLTDSYTNKLINRDTPINGKCISTNCNDTFSRSFRELMKLNGYCANCCKEIGKTKIIETNIKKFGCNNAMQNNFVKQKQTNTILEKYGVEHISQLDKIKEQKKLKSIEKYGTNYVLQSPIIREQIKQTNLEKYGVENPQQNIHIQKQTSDTIYEKFGEKCYFHTLEFKNKTINTNMIKYGVPHHSQNAAVAETILKNSYKLKQYTFPSGKIINYQGYENFAFDELIHLENTAEADIITNRTEVPEIWYYDKSNKKRRHFVDMYIKSQNRCIEVKSKWTNQDKNNVLEKQIGAINLGYKYDIWIFDKTGKKLDEF